MYRSLRAHLTLRIWDSDHFSCLDSARWTSSISLSSPATSSFFSSRTRLREPTASAMRRLAAYQREDSGIMRMPTHRAMAGREHRMSM
ncbi:Uncharacterised protein [Mycobacteroides abscessus subsp. abscessus]|nr:Uncharacterised protein [Mycobacteroides abscessus subsp. abscessus]